MIKFKPYMVVNVLVDDPKAEGNRRYFAGEVISYPTPENTIMIRRVPGHPGTLEEVHLDRLSLMPFKPRYVQYAVVDGRGSFPIDMLRYDSCVPVNFDLEENDLGQIKAVIKPGLPEPAGQLIVADVTATRKPEWTTARWASFLWGIRHLRTERITGASSEG